MFDIDVLLTSLELPSRTKRKAFGDRAHAGDVVDATDNRNSKQGQVEAEGESLEMSMAPRGHVPMDHGSQVEVACCVISIHLPLSSSSNLYLA